MSNERFRHDDDTIRRGHAHIAEIRAQLGSAGRHDRGRVGEPSSADVDETTASWSPDRMAAEMAAAADREQLVARVRELEKEVVRLRSSLAAVIEAAATGVRTES